MHRGSAIATLATLLLVLSVAVQADISYQWDIGLNFTGSTFGIDSGYIPPDTMGGVGPDHIVELINGAYRVYDKTDGSLVAGSSLDAFWTSAGAGNYLGADYAFDPRVLYDPFTGRWYASSVDSARSANRFLLAVSDSADPTSGWTGWAIDADSDDTHWADFATLGFDASGVYLAANMFPLATGSTQIHLIAVSKSDLIATTPSLTYTIFEGLSANATGYSVQPVVDMDNSGLPGRLLSAYNSPSGYFKRSSFISGPGGYALETDGGFISVDTHTGPPSADQPGTAVNITTNDDRFSSNLVCVNGSIWGVHSIEVDGRAALRWFEIDEATNVLVQDGIIADPNLSLYYGSIAVTEYGGAAIGFSGSSDTQYVSSYAVVGEMQDGTMTFGDLMLLQAGVADYQRLASGRNRWGDYSATVVDPLDPWSFWTFQEYVSAEDVWSTRITQLKGSLVPEPGSIALFGLGLGALAQFRRRRRSR